jgi:hypothetical protein
MTAATEQRLREEVARLDTLVRKLAVGLDALCRAVEEVHRRDAALMNEIIREPQPQDAAPTNGRQR